MGHSVTPRCIHKSNLRLLPQIIWEICSGHHLGSPEQAHRRTLGHKKQTFFVNGGKRVKGSEIKTAKLCSIADIFIFNNV